MEEETPRKRHKSSKDAAIKKGGAKKKDTKTRKPASSGRTVAFNRAVGKKTNDKINSSDKKGANNATGNKTENVGQNGGGPSFLVWRGYQDQHGQPIQGANQPSLATFSEQFPPLTDGGLNPYLAGQPQQPSHPGFFAAPYFQQMQPTDYMNAMSGVSFDATSSFFVQQDQTSLAEGREGNLESSAGGLQQDESMFVQHSDTRASDTVLEQGDNGEQQPLGELGDDAGVTSDLGADQQEAFGHGEGQVAYHFQLRGDGEGAEQQDGQEEATENEETNNDLEETARKHQEEMAEFGAGTTERLVFLANKARKVITDKKTSKEDALRMVTVQQYFALLATGGKSKAEISELLATSLQRGVYFAKKLRADAQMFERRGFLPPITQGKHTKIPSLLVQNEGVLQKRLDEYLYGTPNVSRRTLSLKKHLDAFLRSTNFLGPHGKPVTSISMETCRIWLKKFEKVKYVKGTKLPCIKRSLATSDLLQNDPHTATLPALPTIPRLPQPLPLQHAAAATAHANMGIGTHGAVFGGDNNPFGNHAEAHSFFQAHGMFQHHQHSSAFGAHDPLRTQGAARFFPAATTQLQHPSLPLLPQQLS